MDAQNQLAQAQREIAGNDWQAAAARLERLVRATPENVDALNLHGLVLRQLGQPVEALAALRRAMSIAGPHPVILTNLGTTLEDLGEVGQAERCYRIAVDSAPEMPPAAFNLGRLLFNQARYGEAEQAFGIATRAAADDADAWNSLGAAASQLGKRGEARDCFEKAVALQPRHVDALLNLGSLLLAQPGGRELPAAESCCQRAIDAAPDDARCWNLHGLLDQKTGRGEAAERSFRQALSLQPDFAPALSNLGHLLVRRGELEAAEHALGEAAQIAPANPDVANNLGFLRLAQWRLHEAIALFRKTLAALPQGHDAARLNLGAALTRAGRVREAIRVLAHCVAAMPHEPVAFDDLLMALLYEDDIPADLLLSRHREYAVFFEMNAEPARAAPRWRSPGGPLRVGFVSADFRQHPVAHFLAPLVERLPAQGIETIAYNNSATSDATTARLKAAFSEWHDILALSDDAAAALIADQVDVLVDLSGHTDGNRLGVFIRRPAPVQVTWLGYPATTGLRCFDWRLVDAITDPPGSEAWHTEQLYRLPGCFLTFRPPADSQPVAPRTDDDFITFGCFNTLAKVSEACRLAWAEILTRLPTARLVIKARALADPAIAAETLAWFEQRGIRGERLSLLGWVGDSGHHLDLYNTIDIALDPFPYAGTTTTCESLWMGVPVVTLAGRIHSQRVGASLLGALQLDDWVATSRADYVALCVDWAGRRDDLRQIKAGLRERLLASPLCDDAAFAQNFAAALAAMAAPDRRNGEPIRDVGPSCQRRLPDDVSIFVPDSLNQITNYVLLERGDWFEDEIRFLRDIVQAGHNCIDVGANYGVYTLSLARRCGPPGKVVAIEPSPATAVLLRESVRQKGFANVEIVEAVASNRSGRARLSVFGNSEQNRVASGDDGIDVASIRLDELARDTAWDVLKIDAEGHELAVLEGAADLLRRDSPLVMLEVCADERGENFAPVQFLLGLGYRTYRLVGELGVLVPVEVGPGWDPYWLNVFACTPGRAAQLAAEGRLIQEAASPTTVSTEEELLGPVPALAALAGSMPADAAPADHRAAIACYARSTDRNLDRPARYRSLVRAWEIIQRHCAKAASAPTLSTFSRIAAAMNHRTPAILALEALLERPLAELEAEPCLPADADYDAGPAETDVATWLRTAALEKHTQLKTWSTFYTGPELHPRLLDLARAKPNNSFYFHRLSAHSARFHLT